MKILISADDFRLLKKFLSFLTVQTALQTNYYYDTREEIMRKANTTVRVRQKGNQLKGTIKRHLADGCSIEEHFHVDMLPRVIMWDGMPLWLKGSLQTERKIFQVCDGIILMLDLNQYLGTVDYELEIEYSETLRKQADGILILIGSMVGKSIHLDTVSKSERFFQRLNSC